MHQQRVASLETVKSTRATASVELQWASILLKRGWLRRVKTIQARSEASSYTRWETKRAEACSMKLSRRSSLKPTLAGRSITLLASRTQKAISSRFRATCEKASTDEQVNHFRTRSLEWQARRQLRMLWIDRDIQHKCRWKSSSR